MKQFWLTTIFLISLSLYGESYSFRSCTLLPITDTVGGAIGYKLFSKVELDLKENRWCHYQSNSQLISMFSKYRDNLPQHLKNPVVLQTVADKLKVGSLIRVGLTQEINSIEVQLDVISYDGEDLLFSERIIFKRDEIDLIANQILAWLDIYSKIIPYDGIVRGVLGDQITIDAGKNFSIKTGQEFVVKRGTQTKKHPLLKKIVEWESIPIGTGKVFNVSENQALGQVKVYIEQGRKIALGDWVRFEPIKETKLTKDEEVEGRQYSFGKLGVASAYLTLSSTSYSSSTTSNNRMGGNLFGVDFRAEAWITRNYFALGQFGKNLGSVKKTGGSPSTNQLGASQTSFKFGGGYKFLPLGYFYGPQIDLYLGYTRQLFGIESSRNDGFGEYAIGGFLIGVGSNIPLSRDFRVLARAEFIPLPKVEDVEATFGSNNSINWLQLEFGVKKFANPSLSYDALIEMTSAKATFDGTTDSTSFRDTQVKLGASLNF